LVFKTENVFLVKRNIQKLFIGWFSTRQEQPSKRLVVFGGLSSNKLMQARVTCSYSSSRFTGISSLTISTLPF